METSRWKWVSIKISHKFAVILHLFAGKLNKNAWKTYQKSVYFDSAECLHVKQIGMMSFFSLFMLLFLEFDSSISLREKCQQMRRWITCLGFYRAFWQCNNNNISIFFQIDLSPPVFWTWIRFSSSIQTIKIIFLCVFQNAQKIFLVSKEVFKFKTREFSDKNLSVSSGGSSSSSSSKTAIDTSRTHTDIGTYTGTQHTQISFLAYECQSINVNAVDNFITLTHMHSQSLSSNQNCTDLYGRQHHSEFHFLDFFTSSFALVQIVCEFGDTGAERKMCTW